MNWGDSEHDLMFRCVRAAYKALGAKDPYEQKKMDYNYFVKQQQDFFEEIVNKADDAFVAKLNIAAAMNYRFLCLSACSGMDVTKTIKKLVKNSCIRDSEIEEFRRVGNKAQTLLYIAASAGEIVADALLIEELSSKYTIKVTVSAHPLLCRATALDAEYCKISNLAEIIDPGADMYGIHLEKASKSFREIFKSSDIILIKNGVNVETLQDCGRDYFVLGADKRDKVAVNNDKNNVSLSTNIRKFLDYIEA